VDSGQRAQKHRLPEVSVSFLETFLPYELVLAQRRALVWGSAASERIPNLFIGLYLVRLETLPGFSFPARDEGGAAIAEHVSDLLREVLRDSDIPANIAEHEHIAVLRDIDPQHAYAVAQRFLASAASSHELEEAGIRTCVGYLIYPLSTQANFPVERWSTLIDLARRMSHRGDANARALGYGLLRGPEMSEAGIPESDLVPLACQNPDTLVKAGILQIQRIQLLST
jgi:hypothetical protein